ncbi:MAG: prepilin peptidase [Thermomicrobiales bacterium]
MPDITFNNPLNPVLQVLILVVVSIAVVTDIRRRRIYNVLTFPTMALGIVLNTALHGGAGLLLSVMGLLLGATIFFIPVAAGGRGAGDLKLLAAVGALGGPVFVFWCAIFTSMVGGLFAVAVLLYKRRLVSVAGGMALDLYTQQAPRMNSNIRLPYAIPIALGAVAALVFRS